MAKVYLIIAYCIAAIAAISVFYYVNAVVNAPQPRLFIAIISSNNTQFGTGFINNTLPFPIIVNYFYCTTPNRSQFRFNYSGNESIYPGTVHNITITMVGNTPLPSNCANWKTSYRQTSYSNPT